jgi:outer membrane immunogenic protein
MLRLKLTVAVGVMLAFTASASADGYRSGVKGAGCALPFNGSYVGVNAGFAQFKSHQNDLDGYFIDNAGYTVSEAGFTGGVQIGYNWQLGCHTLFGVEADWAWAAIDATTVQQQNVATFNLRETSTLNSYGTLRTRTGLVFDNLLLYVTGGLALADLEFRTFRTLGGAAETFSFSETRWGWTVGVGSEWALWKNVSLKSEVLYMDFGDQSYSFLSPALGSRVHFTTQDSVWVARGGLNWRF